MLYKRRRTFLVLLVAFIISVLGIYAGRADLNLDLSNPQIKNAVTSAPADSTEAQKALEELPVKERAAKPDYERTLFMDDWREEGACDKRNIILQRDLNKTTLDEDGCLVLVGVLYDPYTAANVNFRRGVGTSGDVQVDHMVSLSDAWQKGAQELSYKERNNLANDPLNLLAVDGPANLEKSDEDAASWLPENAIYRCAFVARQIAVKLKYDLWITKAEKDAMKRVLSKCPKQVLPIEND